MVREDDYSTAYEDSAPEESFAFNPPVVGGLEQAAPVDTVAQDYWNQQAALQQAEWERQAAVQQASWQSQADAQQAEWQRQAEARDAVTTTTNTLPENTGATTATTTGGLPTTTATTTDTSNSRKCSVWKHLGWCQLEQHK